MVWDILIAAANLDIAALLDIAFSNILWVFILFALSYIFFDGKKPIRSFIHVAAAPLLMAQFLPFVGLAEFSGHFLLIYYLVTFALLKIGETTSFFSSKLIWIEASTLYIAIILFNVFV